MNTSTGGPVQQLSGSDTTGKKTISFYRSTPGEKDVTLTFKADGADCKKTAHFTVQAPVVTEPVGHSKVAISFMGTVGFGTRPEDYVGLKNAPAPFSATGIAFVGQVSIPSGFANGQWGFVQLISETNVIVKFAASGNCKKKPDVNDALDTDLFIKSGDSTKPSPWPTDGGVKGASDTPGISTDTVSEARGTFSFKTYLMFKPPGTGSAWVPVQSVAWGFLFARQKARALGRL